MNIQQLLEEIPQLKETIAQQNRLISSQQLTIHEYQRQAADNRSTINTMADRIKELEDAISEKVGI